MTQGKTKLLVIEDNLLDSYIIERVVRGYDPSVEVLVFNQPEKALKYLREEAARAGSETLTLLLDIQMPAIDGWQFLEAFEALPERTKVSCRLYVLTSSILPGDKLKAESIHRVLDFFNKPLKGRHLKVIFADFADGTDGADDTLPG
jgi:CheY-like chemotaxis protein